MISLFVDLSKAAVVDHVILHMSHCSHEPVVENLSYRSQEEFEDGQNVIPQ